jgi:hypothetical protein
VYKLTLYADDLTLILSDKESISHAVNIFNEFKQSSGLQINRDKTEGLALGSLKGKINDSSFKFDNDHIKVLGIYISNNPKVPVAKNFQSKIDSLVRQLHWWKARNLTLQGRVLISKALGLSKFQYLASVLHIPQDIVREINSKIYEFIWQGKTDKIKRDIFEQDFEKGGLKMTNMNDIVKASSIMWIKKYLDDTNRLWKNTFEYLSKKTNLNLFLCSNFDKNELPATLPSYYSNSVDNWHMFSTGTTLDDNKNDDFIWYNKKIRINDRTVFNQNLFMCGLWRVSDLYDKGNLIPYSTWLRRGASEANRLLWSGIVNSIKSKFVSPQNRDSRIHCGVVVKNHHVSIEKLKQHHIKTLAAEKKYSILKPADHKYKIKAEQIHGNVTEADWRDIFSLLHSICIDNKSKELQYKIVMRIVATNHILYKMNKVVSSRCTFCQLNEETIEHLFFYCIHVRDIWLYVFSKFSKATGHHVTPTLRLCIFGSLKLDDQYSDVINVILLLVKTFIFKTRCEESLICRKSFVNYVLYKCDLYESVFSKDIYKLVRQVCMQ